MNTDCPPISAAGGIMYGTGAMLPLFPLSYVPARGEFGLSDGEKFVPIDPIAADAVYDFSGRLFADDAPVVALPVEVIDAENTPPRNIAYEQDANVQIPIVRPYNWNAVAADRRIVVLDTTPDAAATDEEKAVPGYVPNPGLTLHSKTHEEFDLESFDDTNGVAYLWTYEPAEIQFTFRRTSPVSGWWEVATPDGAGTILFDAAGGTPTTPYAAGGYEITGTATIRFTLNGGTVRSVPVTFSTGFAPADFDAHFVNGNYTKPIAPHPALRSGQSRYFFAPFDATPTVAKGTAFDGSPFLPSTAPVNGVLRVCAYRYGLSLGYRFSGDESVWGCSYGNAVRFKIGKALATWTAGTGDGLLELTTPTPDAKIFYSLDGTAPTVEHTEPIQLTETTTVRWIVRKPCMESSDEFTTVIAFAGADAPADFEENKFSTLPAFSNSPVNAALLFQPKADWYISPNGSGDGKTPQTPGSASAILGIYGATTMGAALGRRNIYAQANASGSVALSHSYYDMTGVSVAFTTSAGMTGFSAYSVPIGNLDAPGRIYLRLTRASGSQILTKTFEQRSFSGAANLRTVWDATAKTLALSLTATPTDATATVAGTTYTILRPGNTDWTAVGASDNNAGTRFEATGAGTGTGQAVSDLYGAGRESLYYATDETATPTNLYATPITVTAPTVYAIRAFHSRTDYPHDLNTASVKHVLASIDPDATASYDEDHEIFFTPTASDQIRHTQKADVVWLTEGTWDVSDTINRYGTTSAQVRLFGGFNADFSRRDVKNQITKFRYTDNTSGLYLGHINGITFDIQEFTPNSTGATMVYASGAYFCTFNYGRDGLATPHGFLTAYHCYYCDFLFDNTNDIARFGNRMGFCVGGARHQGVRILVRSSEGTSCAYMHGMDFGDDCEIDIEILCRDGVASEAITVRDRSTVRVRGGHSGYLSPLTVSFRNDCDIDLAWWNGIYYVHSPAIVLHTRGLRNTVRVDNTGLSEPGVKVNNIQFCAERDQTSMELIADAVAQSLSPTRMTGAELTIAEAVGGYNGNMIRVNAVAPYAGWYSGTPNSDGAPLAGYETPQGTGVALGRYWE